MNISEIKVAVAEAKVENEFIGKKYEKNWMMKNVEQPKLKSYGTNIGNW